MTENKFKFELVLPCYNESKNLIAVVTRAAEAATHAGHSPETFQLVLVENGSLDDSSLVMDQLKKSPLGKWFRKVQVTKNQGYGFGIWSGLKTTQAPYVGWSHADQQCDPYNAFLALEEASKDPDHLTLVKGVRSGRHLKDRIVSKVFELFAFLILGARFKEINAQPKVFHRDLLPLIKNPPSTFAFDLYILYCAKKAKFKTKTIQVLFPSRIHGTSNWASHFLSRYKTILGIIYYMFKLSRTEGRLNRPIFGPLFAIGLILRLGCLFFFGSYFLKDLFIPFLDAGVVHPLENPWNHYPAFYFPYGSMLYLLLFLPKYLGYLFAHNLALGTGPLSLALVKGPLLLLDLWLYFLLTQISGSQSHKLLYFYWLNPVLFYITYIHGQLDVAAICFCTAGLFLLAKNRVVYSALAMSAATLGRSS